jgi:hypothetical protein
MKTQLNEIKRMQQLAGLIKEEYSSNFKVGDKVRFNPEVMYAYGFENPIEYYEGLTGVITQIQHYDIMSDNNPTDILNIELSKPIQPPGGYVPEPGEDAEMKDIMLVKSQGDFDMITKM